MVAQNIWGQVLHRPELRRERIELVIPRMERLSCLLPLLVPLRLLPSLLLSSPSPHGSQGCCTGGHWDHFYFGGLKGCDCGGGHWIWRWFTQEETEIELRKFFSGVQEVCVCRGCHWTEEGRHAFQGEAITIRCLCVERGSAVTINCGVIFCWWRALVWQWRFVLHISFIFTH